MKKLLLVGLIVAVLLMSFACSDDDEKFKSRPPRNLGFYIENDTTAVLAWSPSPNQTRDDFVHYEIFMANTAIDETTIPTTTFTTSDTNQIVPVEVGRRRYFAVRAVLDNEDDSLSAFTNVVDIAGVIMGTDTLYQVMVAGDTLPAGIGFSNEGGQTYIMDPDYFNDIYFYFGTDQSGDITGQPSFKSPHLFDPIYHNASFVELGTASWKSYNTCPENLPNDVVTIHTGRTIAGKTATNNYVKINFHVMNPVPDSEDYYWLVVRYSYQPILNYRCF